MSDTSHVTVIGAGIIGMVTALTFLRRGYQVTVIDRFGPGKATSFGNAGGFGVTDPQPTSLPGTIWKVPGWLLDPEGPLRISPAYLPRLMPWLWRFWRAAAPKNVAAIADAQHALNVQVYQDWLPILDAAGLSDQLQRNGSLTLYRTDVAFQNDTFSWNLRRERGIEIHELDEHEIRQLEPEIGSGFARGVLMPDWSHVLDPYGIVTGIAACFAGDGGEILRAEVTGFVPRDSRAWALETDTGERPVDKLVVCAGAWSHRISSWFGETVPLESERGYHMTLPAAPVRPRRMLIIGEEHFVITPMSMGLRLAGTVEMSGLEAAPNHARSRVLLTKARRVLPGLRSKAVEEGLSEWSGHRPALPDTIPVISKSQRFENVFYGFGHGHLGLTQAATTGRLLADLVSGESASFNLLPYRVDRFR
ncbi:MAG: amino acid dehydrogenase [Rhodospirillaceae bacterium]|nr:amino acid dehydrogenase [Rhodospirillaceae bacterium]